MRWQRAADRLQKRWCDLTAAPDRFEALWDTVIPVVVIGRDHTDVARSTFYHAERIAGVPANGGFGILAAVAGDLEVGSVFFSGGANPVGARVLVLPIDILFGAPPATTVEMQSGDSPNNAATSFGNSINSTSPHIESPADTTVQLDFMRGVILQQGTGIAVTQCDLNQAFSIGFAWRNA